MVAADAEVSQHSPSGCRGQLLRLCKEHLAELAVVLHAFLQMGIESALVLRAIRHDSLGLFVDYSRPEAQAADSAQLTAIPTVDDLDLLLQHLYHPPESVRLGRPLEERKFPLNPQIYLYNSLGRDACPAQRH